MQHNIKNLPHYQVNNKRKKGNQNCLTRETFVHNTVMKMTIILNVTTCGLLDTY